MAASAIIVAGVTTYKAYRRPPPTDPWIGVTGDTTRTISSLAGERAGQIRKEAKERFDLRLSSYQQRLEALNTNLKLQGLLSMIVISLVFFPNAKTFDFVGTQMPVAALRWIVPMALLFLWFQFGYLLNNVIDSRLTLWHMLPLIDSPKAAAPTVTAPSTAAPESVDKVWSSGSLLNDGGFVDAWFRAFRRGYFSGLEDNCFARIINGIVLCCVYAGILGGGHAAILSLLFLGVLHSKQTWGWFLYAVGFLAAIVLLAASYWEFSYGGHHRNWLAFLIAFVTLVGTGIIVYFARGRSARNPGPGARVGHAGQSF